MSSADSVQVPLHSRSKLKELFDQVDRDNDGRVSYVELWNYLRFDRHGMPKNVIRKIHERADRNDDGTLSYEEFERLVLDPEYNIFDKYLNIYIKFLIPPKHRISTKGRLEDTANVAYEEQYSCWRPKLCMILISVVMVILFVIDAVNSNPTRLGPVSWALIYNPHRRKEAWRFLTYMFVHVGFGHLLMNVIVQICLGLPLELVHKWWRVLIVYLFGVLAGSLGTSMVDSYSYLAGARGGIYALIAVHVAGIIMNWKGMRYPVLQLLVFLIVIATDISSAIYNRYLHPFSHETISYAGHFFGALGGLLMGMIVLDSMKVKNREKLVKCISIGLIKLFVIVAIVYNGAASSHFPEQHV